MTKTTAERCSGGLCVASMTSSCPYGCAGYDCAPPTCGNNLVEPPEQCDDGNSSNLDLCSYNCKTCGILTGPALSSYVVGHADAGLELLATASTVIVQFVVHNQGKQSTIVLRGVTPAAVADRPIVETVTIPANLDAQQNPLPHNVTLDVYWPLTPGVTYTISDLTDSNGVLSAVSGAFPDMSLPGIDILGSWDAGDPDLSIPESTNTTSWYTFTGLHACFQ
jgi:cysteine-rich repeat protein